MRVKWFSISLLIITITLIGCNKKVSQTEKENTSSSITDINIDSASEEDNDIDSSIQDDASKPNYDFNQNNIKDYLLYADTLADKINEGTSSGKVIGEYDGADVVEISGEYDSFDKVKKLMGDYYVDEIIEIELNRRYLVNLYGKIGKICADGENFYNISEKSQIRLSVNEDNKKVVEIDAFNDFDDIRKVEYTIEKQNSGKWIITTEKGYLYGSVDTIEKKLFYQDEFLLIVSSQLDDYPSTYALDGDDMTTWVEGTEGNGIGEWFVFTADDTKEVSGIKLINGYAKSDDLYFANNRVKKISIELPDNIVIEKDLEDGILDYQTIEFDKAVDIRSIKIVIFDVYPGSKYNDTCISEIKVYR